MELNRTCSVLVSSCDAYSDLWKPFFSLFFANWSDCPFEIYLGSNRATFSHERVRMLFSDNDPVWSKSMGNYLSQLSTPYVLLVLEDFFFRRPVQTQNIVKALEFLQRVDGQLLRLEPRPGPDRIVSDGFGECLPGSPYRVSTQASIWNRSALQKLLVEGESIWEFEIKGTSRASAYEKGFYASPVPLIGYGHHVVQRGKWFPWEARRFGNMNIGCDFSKRQVMGTKESAMWLAQKSKGLFWEFLRGVF